MEGRQASTWFFCGLMEEMVKMGRAIYAVGGECGGDGCSYPANAIAFESRAPAYRKTEAFVVHQRTW
jgi:hypothetical protein